MFERATPESIGISSKQVLKFVKTLDEYHLCSHDMIMARGNKIFAEGYWAPFDKDFKHRMYSVSKSFISVAVGFMIQDGKLSLDDNLADYYPEYLADNPVVTRHLKDTSIRDLLTMRTCHVTTPAWIEGGVDDRCSLYFKTPADRVPGTVFSYDSPGSFMLCAIVERLSGKPFLEYLKEKVLFDIGFSPDAYCIQAPGGHSFGDSGILCTPMDLLRFARFVMNKGTWNGKRYLNEKYLTEATEKQTSTSTTDVKNHGSYGYGYLIWKAPNDGFAFIGMGDQFAICDPATDFIFILNSDNQGAPSVTRTLLYHELYHTIIHQLGAPLEEKPEDAEELKEYLDNLELFHLSENPDNDFWKEINGVTYDLEKNPMGIRYVRFGFDGKKGTMTYQNEQGEKELLFGLGYNELSLFPQEGYSDLIASVPMPGNRYRCAASADWPEKNKLRIKVQVIDNYFGNLNMVFHFKGDQVGIYMTKNAEAFLNEYEGFANGKQRKN